MPTKIEWTDETWSPITGCTPVSRGCDHCWARRMAQRLKGRFGYPQDEPFRVVVHLDRLKQPSRWKKPRRIFVCSMGDLFHKDVAFFDIDMVMRQILANPQHTFIILTKRPLRALKWNGNTGLRDGYQGLPNLWLGVSVEDQATADERVPVLLHIPVMKHIVSVEPYLAPLQFDKYLPNVDWVIVGGETGPGARDMKTDWARAVRDECHKAGVPFFMKQMSHKYPIPDDLLVREFPYE